MRKARLGLVVTEDVHLRDRRGRRRDVVGGNLPDLRGVFQDHGQLVAHPRLLVVGELHAGFATWSMSISTGMGGSLIAPGQVEVRARRCEGARARREDRSGRTARCAGVDRALVTLDVADDTRSASPAAARRRCGARSPTRPARSTT